MPRLEDARAAADKLLTRVRARGAGELAALAWGRARSTLWSDDRLVILVRDAGGAHDDASADLRLRDATAADAAAYAGAIGTDSPASFRARLGPADCCWLVESNARIVHATWMTTRAAWTRELGGCLQPPAGDAYVYESFTRPEARGRGIYPYALRGIAAAAAARGLRRLWIAVEIGNLPSLRAVAKGGFRAAFELPYARRLGRVTVGLPEGVGGASEPRLRLDRCSRAEASGAPELSEQ